MANRYIYIPNRVIDLNGISDGASIYFYEVDSTTPVSIYSDSDLSTPVSNPYIVDAGAPVPALYYSEDEVRVKVISEAGEVISDDNPYTFYLTLSDLKNYSIRSIEDFGAVGYDYLGAAAAGVDSTAAIQAAIDWASSGDTTLRAVRVLDRFYKCGNITLRNATTLLGSGRQTSGFVAKTGTTGKWFNASNAQKIVLKDLVFYANNLTTISHIMNLTVGQHGTEGYVEGCWFRNAPEGYALYIDGNVSYLRNCTMESCKFGFKGIGTGNKAENIQFMQIGEAAATPWVDGARLVSGMPRSLDISGYQIDRVHIEAPVSGCAPVRFYRGDCALSKITMSLGTASFPVLFEVDNANYDIWSIDEVLVYNPGLVTITESGLLRYGNTDTESWTYVLGTTVSDVNGLSLHKSLRLHGGVLEIKNNRLQAFNVRVATTAGSILQHRIGQSGHSDVSGSFTSKIKGASTTLTNTPLSAAAFSAGASMLNTGILVLDTATQIAADSIVIASISRTNLGTIPSVWAYVENVTINGVQQRRLCLDFGNPDGTQFNLTGMAASKYIEVQVLAFLA